MHRRCLCLQHVQSIDEADVHYKIPPDFVMPMWWCPSSWKMNCCSFSSSSCGMKHVQVWYSLDILLRVEGKPYSSSMVLSFFFRHSKVTFIGRNRYKVYIWTFPTKFAIRPKQNLTKISNDSEYRNHRVLEHLWTYDGITYAEIITTADIIQMCWLMKLYRCF